MYIYYSIGNNSGPWTLIRIVEVSVIGGVHFRRFHCIGLSNQSNHPSCTAMVHINSKVSYIIHLLKLIAFAITQID